MAGRPAARHIHPRDLNSRFSLSSTLLQLAFPRIGVKIIGTGFYTLSEFSSTLQTIFNFKKKVFSQHIFSDNL